MPTLTEDFESLLLVLGGEAAVVGLLLEVDGREGRLGRPLKYLGTLLELFPSWSVILGVSIAVRGGGSIDSKPPFANGFSISRIIS